MKVEMIEINKIKKYANNPRDNKKSISKVEKSLKSFGWQQPIVVDKNMEIIAGHTRYDAAVNLKMKKVPIHIADDLSEAKVKAYRLADNRSGQDSRWNMDALKIEFDGLASIEGFDLSMTAFDAFEIEGFTLDTAEDLEDGQLDEMSGLEDKDIVSKPGDIWLLGDHRVMCGDSTSSSDFEMLMDGEKANLIFTDPPYNVAYSGSLNKDREAIKNDKMGSVQFMDFLTSVFTNLKAAIRPNAGMYVCASSMEYVSFCNAVEGSGFHIRNHLVWVKNHFSLNMSRYKSKFEPLLYCHVANQTDEWYGDNTQTTVWEIDKPARSELHPTMKPLDLVIKAIKNSSKKGDLVIDAFLGSGSTLISSEKTERIFYGMELEPKYVDVIIRRWKKLTDKEAVHAVTQKAFPKLD